MKTWSGWPARILVGIFFLITFLLLGGCAPSGSRSNAQKNVPVPEAPPRVAMTVVPSSAPSEADGAGATTDTASAVIANRMIIYNGYLTLEVADSAAAAEKIKAIATDLGGYVTNANFRRTHKRLRGTITLRVPAESFDQAIGQIKELALSVEKDRTTTEDVTEQYTDLSARLKNLEATETELRELLKTVRKNSKSAEDIMVVYRELATVRGQIEQLKGKMQYLERLTALATISVELTPHAEFVRPGWSPGKTASEALRSLVRAGQGLVDAAIWSVVLILPILAALLAPVLIIAWLLRRWIRSRRQRASSQKSGETSEV